MSFGFSLVDIAVLLRGISKVIAAIKTESVEEFRRYEGTYRQFVRTTRALTSCITGNSLQHDPDIGKALRNTEDLLKRYFSKISAFKPHLGPRRVQNSLLGAIAKIKWMQHTDMLKELRAELDREIGIIHLLVNTKPRLRTRISLKLSAHRVYNVILVTRPPIHSYGPISDKICTPSDRPGAIPWSSKSLDSIPSMMASLRFRRHFALCLVPAEIWASTSTTLAEKLEDQRFWEYHGSDTDCSRGSVWAKDVVHEINAIEDLGIALPSKDAADLCTEYHLTLRQNWEYFNIWLNDADFALCLASLLVGTEATRICFDIRLRLGVLRYEEVVRPRQEACRYGTWAGVSAVAGGVLTGVAVASAAPIAVPVALGGYLTGIGLEVTRTELAGYDRNVHRQKVIARLRAIYPKLDELFVGVPAGSS